jgi:putative Holliday junction resolvase
LKLLALDYGSARTGVAVSDPTGTIARPLAVVEAVVKPHGFARLLDVIREEAPERIVVGLPLTLRGDAGEQAQETLAFVAELEARTQVPIETYDERFTTTMAGMIGSSRHGDDALAAAHLLEGYLTRLAG